MSVYVFLGPSLPVERARAVCPGATYLPPVQQGDVLRLLSRRPSAIGIVDGYFETVPAVWHKEILVALSSGVHVFGAASMGALRAAELHGFGMVGVGEVFAWYRDGALTADDEVAVAHGPSESGYRRLSEALVNIRDACEASVAAGVLTSELAARLVSIAASLHYPERAYPRLAALARAEGVPGPVLDRWLEFVAGMGPALKERDTLALLRVLGEFIADPPGPRQAELAVAPTVFLEALRNEVALARSAGISGPPEDEHTRLRGGKTLAELRQRRLLRVLALQEAERHGWTLTAAEVQAQAEKFCEEHGLTSPASLRAWLQAEELDEERFWEHINTDCLIARLIRLHGFSIERGLADELRFSAAGPPDAA